jgi:Domain of unknown function (DUF3883)
MQETTSEEVLEFHEAGWSCADLYTFLAQQEVTDVADLTIFPSEGYASFHTADEIVRPGDLTDQFNIRRTMDAELSNRHSDWLEAVGVVKLDHEEYFSRLLIEYFEALQDDSSKCDVVAFLVMHRGKLAASSIQCWATIKIAKCTDGKWRIPKEVYLGNELMDSLFGKTYARLAKGLEDDHRAKSLFERFGVKREGRVSDIVDQLERLATEAVTSSSIRVREKVIKWLGSISDETVFMRLSKIAWLPDFDKKSWFAPASVYPKSDMEVMASTLPTDRVFCGIEILLDQLVKSLKMPRPSPELVVGHLENMIDQKLQCSTLIYQYLERWARDRGDLLKPFVNRLRQIPCIPIGEKRWLPNSVFTRNHSLIPWRPVLKAFLERYPTLVKELGVRKEPERDDYVEVLIEIAKRVDQLPHLSQNQVKAAAETAKYCLRALAKLHSDHPNNLNWMQTLKGWKIIPLGGDIPAFATPDRMYILDVSEAFVKRYTLEPLRNHFVPPIGEDEFWRDLGAKSLRESVTIKYEKGAASQPVPGMTRKLQSLQPAIIRIAREATKHDLDELTSIFKRLKVFQDRQIIVRRTVQGSPVQLPQTTDFDFAYDPESHRLVIKEEKMPICVDALAWALEISQASYLGNLRTIIIRCHDLGDAMQELDAMGIPELSARWKPAEALESTEIEVPESTEAEPVLQPDLNFLADTLDDQSEPARLPVPAVPRPRQVQQAPKIPRDQAPGKTDFASDNEQSLYIPPSTLAPRTQRFSSHPDATNLAPQRSRPKPQRQFKTYVYLEPGEPDDNEDKEESLSHATDRRGMEIVMAYETRHGRNPVDVSSDYGLGYDIESTDPDGAIRFIELKTTNEPWGERGVTLSANQFQKALHKNRADRYWLYVVDDLQGQPRVHRIWNPAGRTQHFVFDEGWLDFVEDEEGLSQLN